MLPDRTTPYAPYPIYGDECGTILDSAYGYEYELAPKSIRLEDGDDLDVAAELVDYSW